MPLSGGELGLLLLLGAWVAVDGTSWGQFMVSRPLVAATLAGWVVGEPVHGALIAVILEAFHLTELPVGAARFPEAGPAAVAASAVYAAGPHASSTLLLAVAFALAWEWLAGESVLGLRRLNVKIASLSGHAPFSPRELEWRHRLAVALDALRGMLLVGFGAVALSALLQVVHWGIGERIPNVVLTGALAGLMTSCLGLFAGRTRLFLAGVGLGLLFLLVAR